MTRPLVVVSAVKHSSATRGHSHTMSKGWVISLGSGIEQLPLIRAIQSEGYKCLAFDSNPDAPGKDVADHFAPVSNRDVDEIERMANGWVGIEGVMAAGSEVPDVMAILGHRLGCQNIPVAAGLLLKDKLRYKEILKAANVPHTEAHAVYEGSEKALFDKLKHEVVVKPQRGSGSRGVTVLRHDPMALSIAVIDAQMVCYDILMERYVPGPQISSETLLWDGKASTVAFVDRFYDDGSVKELGGRTPSVYEHERERAHKVIVLAAQALGIRRGTLKCDLVLPSDGWPKIIECTARLSGGPLSKIVKESSGVDYLRQAVRIACGIEPDWEALKPKGNKLVSVDMNGEPFQWPN